ncbi:hypothetical protein AAFF_G00384830 [Aldrovandia affinis]|uniref:Uncharacterized protein n=1 Tax=Aldrovandia affinis TaxID=143900 RepID=A0AAD7R4R9_9TELE|nr:hypothetical protein AAFF_G00384830 [Aldrovandia affinis]
MKETPEAISAALNKAKVDTREHLKTGMVWSYGLICSIMGDANPVSRMVEELQRRHNVVTNLPPQLPYANVTGRPSSSTPPQPAETAAPETGESEQSDHASVSSGEMFQWLRSPLPCLAPPPLIRARPRRPVPQCLTDAAAVLGKSFCGAGERTLADLLRWLRDPSPNPTPGLKRGFLRCSKPPAGGGCKNGRAERVRKPAVCKRAPAPCGQTRSELGSTPAPRTSCPHISRVCMKRETPEAISAALNKAKVDTREHLKTGMVWSYGLICSIMGDANPVSRMVEELQRRHNVVTNLPPQLPYANVTGRPSSSTPPQPAETAAPETGESEQSDHASVSSGEMFQCQPNRHIMLCPVCHKTQDILSAHLRRVCMKRETPEAISAALNKAKVDTREHLKTGMVWSYGLICSIMGDANPVSRMVEELQRHHNVVTNLPPQLPYANVTGRPSSSTPPQPAETAAPETGESEQSDHASVSSGEMFQCEQDNKWSTMARKLMAEKSLYRKHSLDHPVLKGFGTHLEKDLQNEHYKQEKMMEPHSSEQLVDFLSPGLTNRHTPSKF